MRSVLLALCLLSGCYYAPDGSVTPPGPVEPDLQGVALEAYQEALRTQIEGSELTDLIGAIRLTINKAELYRWDGEQVNTEFLENTKLVMEYNSTTKSRWTAFAKWQNSVLKPAIETNDILPILRQILQGLEAANG